MIIIDTLTYPYTQKEKNDFIIKYRRLGIETRIDDITKDITAWDKTDEEKLAEAKANKQAENVQACNNKRYNQSFKNM